MPENAPGTAEQSPTWKGVVIGMPICAVALALAKLNFFGHFYAALDYFHLDMGWPFPYREYFDSRWDDPAPWKIPILVADLFIAYAMLLAVSGLMKELCQGWPKFSLRTIFIATTMIALITCLAKFESTIRRILQILTGLEVGWHLFGESWLVRVPMLFGAAALCFGTVCLIVVSGKFHYRSIMALVKPKVAQGEFE